MFLKKLIGSIFNFTKSHKEDYAIRKSQRMTFNANANTATAATAAADAEVLTVIADAVAMNHDLLSEIIFANDTAFADIDSNKARMLLCASKMAQNNKNILSSIDSEKAKKFCKDIKSLSYKKAKKTICEWEKTIYEWDEAELGNDTDLGSEADLTIDDEYRTKVNDIIANISKDSEYVADTIKQIICAEQRRRVDKIIKSLNNSISIVVNLGIDMNNITDDDRYLCLNDYDYFTEKEYRFKIITVFKYNAYFLNTLFNNSVSEDSIIKYINDKQRKDYYKRLSSVFTNDEVCLG